MTGRLSFFILMLLSLSVSLFAEVFFDPPSAVLPSEGERVRVEIRNGEMDVLEIDFLPSDEGLSVSPPGLVIEGGDSASFFKKGRSAVFLYSRLYGVRTFLQRVYSRA